MELNLVSKDKKLMVIEFLNVKETIVYPLVDRLLTDEDVLVASYRIGHPQLDKPKLTVKTKKSDPEAAIKKAADSLEEEFKLMKKEFEKALKSPKSRKSAPKKKAKTTKTKATTNKKSAK